MSWLQLRINCQRESVTPIETALGKLNTLAITFEDNADQPIFEPELGETPLWFETRITGLFNAEVDTDFILEKLKMELPFQLEHHHWHILEDKDWEREWMLYYTPIQCGEQFWICPSWTPPPNPTAVNLLLDPGLAFGTGTHPTTFLCLQWIAEQAEKYDGFYTNKRVIDYGCGSGVLGIASLLLGAPKVIGIDIDPQALLATKENVLRNQIAPENFPVFFPTKSPEDKTDLLLANILAGPLVELAPTFAKLTIPGAQMCLSGILAGQKNAVSSAYTESFNIDEIREKEGWICILATRK